jgi:hypothetical protein
MSSFDSNNNPSAEDAIESIHLRLVQSQFATNHQDENAPRLTRDEHFALWDEMWRLVKARGG